MMIKLENVSKVIKDKNILVNVNLEFKEGQCYLVKGHNGSGKTMLLRMICGFLKPTDGKVIYDKEYSYGVIIENPAFFLNETAMYNMKYLADINKKIGKEEIEKWLKKFNLLEFKDKKVKTFSLGMKQRLALCQAFMESPDVILLDEPFNAIDEDNLNIVYDLLKEQREAGKIIVIASHIENNFNYDSIITMNEGKISNVK